MHGYIDQVTPEGVVEGWAWNEQAPDERVHITVLVDGIESGKTLACLYREDLHRANIGDGRYFFRVVLAGFPSGQKRAQMVTLINTATGEVLGEPYVLHDPDAMNLDDRLSELETRNRLLETRIAELDERARNVDRPVELFSVVGAFFTHLAQDLAQGRAPTLDQRLDGILRAATRAHSPITLAMPDQPSMTILVEAACPLAQLHTCLTALKRASSGATARVMVLDTGEVDEMALIPSIVRGIYYIRIISDKLFEWVEAERADNADVLLLLSGRAVVGEVFLSALAKTLADDDRVGAVGGLAVSADGTTRHGGICMLAGAFVDCAKTGRSEMDPAAPCPVHALSYHAAAFRRSALRAVGGLDLAFGDDLGAATIDLCFRLHQAGWSVIIQPLALLALQPDHDEGGGWITPGLAASSRAGELLRERWLRPDVTHSFPLCAASDLDR